MHFYSVNASNILDIRLLGSQLIKKFLSVHGFRRSITVFTRARHLLFREPHESNNCSTYIQGDQKVSVHLMITVQKNMQKCSILNNFNHLP